jgi:hypothetical protein
VTPPLLGGLLVFAEALVKGVAATLLVLGSVLVIRGAFAPWGKRD